MTAEPDVGALCLRLGVIGVCALPVHGCGGSDVEVETSTEERQTVSAGDEVVQLMRSPLERLIYDKPVNLARPVPADSIAHPTDTTHAGRNTAR
jgi:hypothetical protein